MVVYIEVIFVRVCESSTSLSKCVIDRDIVYGSPYCFKDGLFVFHVLKYVCRYYMYIHVSSNFIHE